MTRPTPESTEQENTPKNELRWTDNGGFISRLAEQCGSAEIKDLAKFTKLKYQTVKNYISGEQLPNVETLAVIALNTGLSLDYLLLDRGKPYREDSQEQNPLGSPELAEAKDRLWSFITKIPPLKEVKIRVESDGLHIDCVSDSTPTTAEKVNNVVLMETTPVDTELH